VRSHVIGFAAALGLAMSLNAAQAETIFPPGSRIGLVPPKDMALSKRFTGFENPGKAAAITLMEMPAEAFPQVSAGLTAEALKSQGVTVTSREPMTIAGKPALLIIGDQTGATKLRKWVLAVNDPTATAFIVAQSLRPKEGYSDAEMLTILKSVALRAPLPIEDQIAALSFHLRDRAGFRPVKVLSSNSLLMTEGPKDQIKAVEQPILVIAASSGATPPPGEGRDRLARAALSANKTFQELAVERAQSFRQGGVDWHEIVARAKDAASGEPIVVMQTIRFGAGGYLRMVGAVRADKRDELLPRFRKVIDSVEPEES
jgi:hypothetical protein